jgi:hypothetical protein
MKFPFRLTAWGQGKLIAWALILGVVGLHSLGQTIGLIDSDVPKSTEMTPAQQQLLAERDSEVKLMIAAREAQAKAVRAADGAGY